MFRGVTAVVDANVLFGRYQRNLEVFGEERAEKVERSIQLIREQLDGYAGTVAETTAVEGLVESVRALDPDDRHVVAAALCERADVIVTHNLKDFDGEWCAERRIAVLGLDDFLARLVGADAGQDAAIGAALIAYARYPPNSMRELLSIVRAFAPRFADAAARLV